LDGVFLEQRWGRMRVWRAGAGPPLIAVHGLGGSGRYWGGLVSRVPGYTTVAPDLAGFGESSKPEARYDLLFHLACLDELIETLSIEGRIALLGHSVGGVIAAGWAAAHPERVASLALVATPYPGVHRLPRPVAWVGERPYSPTRRIPVEVARVALFPFLVPTALLRGQSLSNIRDYTRQSLAARTRTARSLIEDPTTARGVTALKELPTDVRTLCLTGKSDRLTTVADMEGWSSILPRGDWYSLPGGHQLLLKGGFATLGDWLSSQMTPAIRRACTAAHRKTSFGQQRQ
jgi:pimeloyl-ACP methyl ester carboxylesterase